MSEIVMNKNPLVRSIYFPKDRIMFDKFNKMLNRLSEKAMRNIPMNSRVIELIRADIEKYEKENDTTL